MKAAPLFSSLLAAVLMAGVLVTWSPAVWPIAVLQCGLLGLALTLAVLALVQPGTWAPAWPRTALYIPLALLACWAPLQLALHTTIYRFDTWYAALYWFTNVTAFLLAAVLLREPGCRARFSAALLYFGCGVVVLSIVQSYTSPNKVFWLFESRYRVIGPFVYKNQFAAFVELLMPLALYRMLTDRKNSVMYALLSATMFAAVVASASRAGTILLGLEVLAVLAAGWSKGMITKRMAGLLFLQVAVLLAICTAIVGWEALGEHFQDQTSGNMRWKLNASTWRMIRDWPGMGVGLGNWKTAYPAYALFDAGLFANAAHNDWAQWAAEGGLPFAALLLWIFGAAVGAAWREPWGAGVVFVLLHSGLDYPTREPVVGAILFTLLGGMVAARARPGGARIVAMPIPDPTRVR